MCAYHRACMPRIAFRNAFPPTSYFTLGFFLFTETHLSIHTPSDVSTWLRWKESRLQYKCVTFVEVWRCFNSALQDRGRLLGWDLTKTRRASLWWPIAGASDSSGSGDSPVSRDWWLTPGGCGPIRIRGWWRIGHRAGRSHSSGACRRCQQSPHAVRWSEGVLVLTLVDPLVCLIDA